MNVPRLAGQCLFPHTRSGIHSAEHLGQNRPPAAEFSLFDPDLVRMFRTFQKLDECGMHSIWLLPLWQVSGAFNRYEARMRQRFHEELAFCEWDGIVLLAPDYQHAPGMF